MATVCVNNYVLCLAQFPLYSCNQVRGTYPRLAGSERLGRASVASSSLGFLVGGVSTSPVEQ